MGVPSDSSAQPEHANLRRPAIGPLGVLVLALPALPALLLASLHPVSLPWMDQWSLVELFAKLADGRAGAADFFAPHNGVHQIALARAVHSALAFASGWNMKLELLFNLAWIAAAYVAVCRLALHSSAGRSPWAIHVANFLSGMLLFSLAQYRLFLWGWATQDILAASLPIVAIALLHAPPIASRPGGRGALASLARRLGPAALCCLAASFSKTTGLAAWPALIPSVYGLGAAHGRRAAATGTWVGLAVFAILLVQLAGSGHGAESRSIDDLARLVHSPVALLRYFSSLLGIPIGFFAARAGSWSQSTVLLVPIGALCLGLYVGLGFLLIRRARRTTDGATALRLAATPWISLGLFSLGYAVLNTIGRAQASNLWGALTHSYLSMYGENTAPLVIAVLQMGALLHTLGRGASGDSEPSRHSSAVRRWAFPALATSAAITLLLSQWTGWQAAQSIIRAQHEISVCFALRRHLAESDACLSGVESRRRDDLATLERLGFRSPRRDVSWSADPGGGEGAILPERTTRETAGALAITRIQGWARLDRTGRAPDWVALARSDKQAIVAIGRAGRPSPDAAGERGSSDGARLGWEVVIREHWLEPGRLTLKAWAFDEAQARLIPLAGTVALDIE